LAGGEMAESTDFLLLVESVCSHFHTAENATPSQSDVQLVLEKLYGYGGERTGRKPCRSTSASAPSSWCP
jgi:hypothetical protein